jgi:hypothetical protein
MKQNWSRRELEAFGEPLGDSVTQRKLGGGYICGGGGKGGGGGGTPPPQQSTAYQTNIPEYAKPYVTNMLEATQRQLFEGAPTAEGGFNITGFKPYRPYSTDVSNYFAPFSPMQRQAQQATAALQTPGEYQQAIGLTGLGAMGSMGLAGQGAAAAQQGFGAGQQYAQNVTSPGTMQAYMSPYQQSVTDVAKAAAVREAQMAQNAQNLGASRQGTYGGARQALMQGERERNLLSNLSNIQAQGSQSAYDRALQSQQFGANLGLQGLQAGYGGLGVGLQGLGQTMQGAGQLGQLGGAQLQAQQGIIGLQNQMGGQQQAMEQAKINQATQDYATQQQYPLLQLGMMSNMLRGLPMQATTTQTYQAAPAPITQGLGLLAGAAGAKQAGLFAEGGTIKELASGGVAGYANRGMVQANPDSGVVRGIRQKLMMMNADELNRVAQSSPSEEIRAMAIQILQEQKIREQAETQAQQSIAQDQRGLPTPVTERAGLPAAPAGAMNTLNAASGGIVAFANEGEVDLDEETAARLQQQFLERQQYENFARKQREAAGVGAPKAALGEFYTKEQAALADAESKNKGYNLMDIGFNLATQTGPLTQAAGKTGRATLPNIIAREEGLRGRRGEVAKGLAEVAEGERLMKLGDITGGNAMFDKAKERETKESIASTRASVADRADNHAKGYLADARAKGDKRPDEIVLFEGRNDYLDKLQKAQMARAGVAAQQVNITGQNLTRDDANKEVSTFGTPGNDRFQAELKKAKNDPNYKNLSSDEKKKIKADIKERVRDEIMAKNQSGGGTNKPKVIKLD